MKISSIVHDKRLFLSKKAKFEYLRILSAHGAGIMGNLLLAADAMASELP